MTPCSFKDHDDWFNVFAAAHSALRWLPDRGLNAFVKWSTSDPQYASAGSDIAHRWKTLDSSKSKGVTVRTLFRLVAEEGDAEKSAVAKRVEAALDFEPVEFVTPPPKVVKVEYGFDEETANSKIVGALRNHQNVYQRLGELVEVNYLEGSEAVAVEMGAAKGTPIIRILNHHNVS